jgi:hypothetical protein
MKISETQEEERVLEKPVHPAGFNRRRSPRVVCSVPLLLSLGSHALAVRTAVINSNGALVLCPESISEESAITLFNDKTEEHIEASVVWSGLVTLSLASPTLFQFKLGVEFRQPSAGFWGPDYQP